MTLSFSENLYWLSEDRQTLKEVWTKKPENATQGQKAVYILDEAFGIGGLHFIHRDLVSKLQKVTEAGISVVVCSQCLYEASDFSVYETGKRIITEDTKKEMKKILEEIQDGTFASKWIAETKTAVPTSTPAAVSRLLINWKRSARSCVKCTPGTTTNTRINDIPMKK